MSAYFGQSGEPKPGVPGSEVARRRPDTTLAESVGTALVAAQTEQVPTREKVGVRFANLVTNVVGGEQAEAYLRRTGGRELFRIGTVTTADQETYSVAAVSNNYTTGDMIAVQPSTGPRPDNPLVVYTEMRDLSQQPDKVLRATMNPITGKVDPQERDGPIGPGEMTGLEQIAQATQWGPVQQREAGATNEPGDMYRVGQPFRPEIE